MSTHILLALQFFLFMPGKHIAAVLEGKNFLLRMCTFMKVLPKLC